MDCPSQHIVLEKELFVTIYTTIPKKLMTVKLDCHEKNKHEWFSVLYINAGHGYILIGSDKDNKTVIDNAQNILLTFSRLYIELHISTNKDAELLEITFSKAWLVNQYSNHQKKTSKNFLSLEADINNYFATGLMDKEDNSNVQKFIDSYHLGANIFRLRFFVLSLITNLYQKNIGTENKIIPNDENLPHEISLLLEKIKAHLNSQLPTIKDLAKELSTSESTLQRHFKSIYGKSVYEYYLELKMQKAKKMLSKNETNVKQVAYLLGYDDVSSFINTFKKHIGVLPSEHQKTESLNDEDG